MEGPIKYPGEMLLPSVDSIFALFSIKTYNTSPTSKIQSSLPSLTSYEWVYRARTLQLINVVGLLGRDFRSCFWMRKGKDGLENEVGVSGWESCFGILVMDLWSFV